jgi:Na+-driven multidrug efflux pump
MVVSNSLNVLGPTIDMMWVGKLGPDSMAAVGLAGMVVMLVNAFLMGIFTGLRSMIARYIGAQDRKGAIHVSQQAFAVAGILGVILAIIGISLDRWILGLLGVTSQVLEIGSAYMRINFIGMIAMSLRFTTDGIMQASARHSQSIFDFRLVVFPGYGCDWFCSNRRILAERRDFAGISNPDKRTFSLAVDVPRFSL